MLLVVALVAQHLPVRVVLVTRQTSLVALHITVVAVAILPELVAVELLLGTVKALVLTVLTD
jgi:hypothetical protein